MRIPNDKNKVLIVGAGSSGIAAIKEALEVGLDPIAYEASSGVGGAWRYNEDPGDCQVRFDKQGWATFASPSESNSLVPPPSPMYDSLKTNVPTSLMRYRGSQFPPQVGLFASHAQVQAYLESYASPLEPYIRYNHRVTRIRHTTPADEGEQRKWFAEIAPTDDSAVINEQFDFVMIANGHYSKPFVPFTEGLRSWKGELQHARWYRNTKAFENKTVLVVGNSASGYDITREIAMSLHSRRTSSQTPATLPKIYQSARSASNLGIPFDAPDSPEWAKEVKVFPPIRKVEDKTITFEDGSSLDDVDTIIYATGYYFSFPFLHSTDAPWSSDPVIRSPPTPNSPKDSTSPVDGGLRLHNLDDRFLFYLPDSSAVFLCLPYLVIPFPLAQLQARLASLQFANSPQLPSPLEFVPGVAEDEPEVRSSVVLGHPKQYDLMDRMMRESGDIVENDQDGDEDVGEGRGKYGKTSQAERDLRGGAKALRRSVLGY